MTSLTLSSISTASLRRLTAPSSYGVSVMLAVLAIVTTVTTISAVRMHLLDSSHGRYFLAALVLLFYMVFCLMIFARHRRLQSDKELAMTALAGNTSEALAGQPGYLIVFASQTGYAEQLALQTAESLQQANQAVQLCDIARLDIARLQSVALHGRVLFIVSTTGEGDAPDSAAGFMRKLTEQGSSLNGLRYGVLALGDRSYKHYCAFGHTLDHWLSQHGAQAQFDLIDVDSSDVAAANAALRHWQHCLGVLSGHTEMADWSRPGYERWILRERRLLNPGSLGEPAFHLALQAAGESKPTPPVWQAGDIVEIGPRNAPDKVAAALLSLGLDGAQQVYDAARQQNLAIRDLLARSRLPEESSHTPAIAAQLKTPEQAQALADTLVPLPHRAYSIASLPADGQLQLLVRQTSLPQGGLGLGSGWLTAYLQEGGEVDLRITPNRNFHPPQTDCPLILIGNGTGLAGLRAHIKARIAAGHLRNWLIFGERSAQHDFFHQQEIENWHAQGQLQYLDLAFSRDQAQRIYVQDKLRESAEQLQQWVAQGAAIYVCGSLTGMAAGVAQALTDILSAETLAQMAEQGRYRRDVY